MNGNAYDRRRAQREAQRERRLAGETLAAFHAREHAKPPTLAEIFAKNRADKTVCTRTPDMFAQKRRTRLPLSAVGLRLARIDSRENLLLCEAIRFDRGFEAVEMTLRRAAISGRVELEARIANHFADLLDEDGDIVATVALDRESYSALKNRWMRCKIDRSFAEPRR